MSFRRTLAILVIGFLLMVSLADTTESVTSSGDRTGPYTDELLVKHLEYDDQQIEALLENEVDIIAQRIDPSFIDQLSASNDITIKELLRNGYGYMIINCEKYPLNVTALRRAMAFGINKQSISNDSCVGPCVSLDSVIPRGNPWSVEGQLDYSYYEADVTTGNALLNEAGFDIDPMTGFRKAPNGESFNLTLEIILCSCPPTDVINAIRVGLEALNVSVIVKYSDYADLYPRIYNHQSFDLALLGRVLSSYDIDWLADYYWSENADEPWMNFPRWRNASFDGWREQLLHGTSHEEVYEAAIEMQKIWVYECPEIITYQNIYHYACRSDVFIDFYIDPLDGFENRWTPYFARSSDPSIKTMRIADNLLPHYNPFQPCSSYSSFSSYLPYDTLFVRDIHGEYIPWLAETSIIETHDDDSSILDGRIRFSFDILQNMTWSDGVPFTAEDVAWSYSFLRDDLTNIYSPYLSSLTSAYAPSPSRLVLEFEEESYWHRSKMAEIPILPRHEFILKNITSTAAWSPDPYSDPLVTSGPYRFAETHYDDDGSYIIMEKNQIYFYAPSILNGSSTTGHELPTIPDSYLISIAVTSAALVVIVMVVYLWRKGR